MSDSIPFISLLLSGYTELFSKEINFISDYNQYALRLIEYNIYPYFVLTYEDSSKLVIFSIDKCARLSEQVPQEYQTSSLDKIFNVAPAAKVTSLM